MQRLLLLSAACNAFPSRYISKAGELLASLYLFTIHKKSTVVAKIESHFFLLGLIASPTFPTVTFMFSA